MVDTVRNTEARRQNIGLVLAVGPDAFVRNGEKLPPKCKVGDWIHYAGSEREVIYPGDHICYYINDDRIFSIIPEDEVQYFLNGKK